LLAWATCPSRAQTMLTVLTQTRPFVVNRLGAARLRGEALAHSEAEVGRALTTEMIYRIHNAWKIPPELLIKPYRLRKAA